MKVLIACEFSGVVRDAFFRAGHDAWSCDFLPTEIPGNHVQGDVREILDRGWDMMIAHPPCRFLARSGSRWWKETWRQVEQKSAINFVEELLDAPIDRIAIENPVGILSTAIRRPDCITQPWWFGEPETKATCFWLKNLPPLLATEMGQGRRERVHRLPPSADRWKERSRTLPGVAAAMVTQWGYVSENRTKALISTLVNA
jgi:hypothetical protein